VLEDLSERRRAAISTPGTLEERTWHVFGRLMRLDPASWLPELVRRALHRRMSFSRQELDSLRLSLWEGVAPPPARQTLLRRRALRGLLYPAAGELRRGRVTPLSVLRQRLARRALEGGPLEPPTEVGAILRTSRRVLYVLPVLDQELEMEVPCDRDRDAILRALDAGLYESESARLQRKRFYLILLYCDRRSTPLSVARLRLYKENPVLLRRALAHRRGLDTARVAENMGLLRWRKMPGNKAEPEA